MCSTCTCEYSCKLKLIIIGTRHVVASAAADVVAPLGECEAYRYGGMGYAEMGVND